MIIKNAKAFTKNFIFEDSDIYIEGERIAKSAAGDVIDAEGMYAIPGLVDIHFHGALGFDFSDADIEGLQAIANYEADCGVLAICPATLTLPEERLSAVMSTASKFSKIQQSGANLVGINMEGPYISRSKCGAQNPAYIRDANMDEFIRLQEKSGGLIKLLDLAPEAGANMEFIKQFASKRKTESMLSGVNLSIAHTLCTYEEAKIAFENGVNHLTHTFNAMPGLESRAPGPIAAAAECGAIAELIADGNHVSPAMIRLIFKLFGSDRVALISDSIRAAGCKDGVFDMAGLKICIENGKAVLLENKSKLAGSISSLFDCMKNAIRFGISIEDAVKSATYTPAKSIGIENDYGVLKQGAYADILLLNKDLDIVKIIKHGKIYR